MPRALFAAVALLFLTAPSIAALPDAIPTDAGLLSGTTGKNPRVRIFKGIPYAQPPVANLRWHDPLPAQHWDGIRKADHFSAACTQPPYVPGSFYQLEYFTGPQPAFSEDCLYLNIFTAAQSPQDKKPVMVWIHGGANIQGYASEPCFDGEALALHDVILVSINYRLGIFGFFAHPELSAESPHHVFGNYAQLDQIAALQWVRNNIANFGGDRNNVTIFGQSSGGASVARLLTCPLAKGLFDRAIIQSSSIVGGRPYKIRLPEAEQNGIALAKKLGANSLADLRKLPAEKLLELYPNTKFDSVIDSYVFPEVPLDTYLRNAQAQVPLIIGSTADEAPLSPTSIDRYTQDMRDRFGTDADTILSLYPANSNDEAGRARHDARTDQSAAATRAQAKLHAAANLPVYLYRFSHKPPGRDIDTYGAFHAAELEYVFNTLDATNRPWQETDRNLATVIINYWTQFAASGNPNAPGLPLWPKYDPASDQLLDFADVPTSHAVPNTTRLDQIEKILLKQAH